MEGVLGSGVQVRKRGVAMVWATASSGSMNGARPGRVEGAGCIASDL